MTKDSNTPRTIQITELELVTLTDLAGWAIHDHAEALTDGSLEIVKKFHDIAGNWILERAGYIK